MDKERITKKELEEKMNNYKPTEDLSQSFFDIVNRSHDENMISLMLKYLFENDENALKNVLNKGKNPKIKEIEIKDIINEYVISNSKRIDIFIKAKIDGEDSVIVIENKVYSHEHDSQCKTYFDYIERVFKNKKNYFLFLKPEYNTNEPECDNFTIITYDDILNTIENEEDIYIKDFKKTISNNLVVREMNELDIYLLDHFKEIYRKVNDLDKMIINYFKNDYGEQIKKYLGCKNTEFYPGDYSIRFYNDNWYSGWDKNSKKDLYYFYVELVSHSRSINKPVFQRIIKRYSDEDSYINKFIADKYPGNTQNWGGCFVVDRKEFEIDESIDIFSQQWKEELIKQGKTILKQMFEDELKDVNEFLNEYKK